MIRRPIDPITAVFVCYLAIAAGLLVGVAGLLVAGFV